MKLYQPSSGTEGDGFYDAWCRRCDRDKAMRDGEPVEECDDNELCQIIADSLAYDVSDQKYPREWCYDANGRPQCTAFVPLGTIASLRASSVAIRDDRTVDMFSTATAPVNAGLAEMKPCGG